MKSASQTPSTTSARHRTGAVVKGVRTLIGIAAALVVTLVGLAAATPQASAQRVDPGAGGGYQNWTCWGPFKQTNVQYERTCGDVASRPGVRIDGRGWRTFPTNHAIGTQVATSFSIKDTTPHDGKCAYARIRMTNSVYEYKPVWLSACNGATKHYNVYLQDDGHISGYSARSRAKMWICRGKNPKYCKLVWNQPVGTRNPYLKS